MLTQPGLEQSNLASEGVAGERPFHTEKSHNRAPYISSCYRSFLVDHLKFISELKCLRPYHLEYTSSRPITEVKGSHPERKVQFF